MATQKFSPRLSLSVFTLLLLSSASVCSCKQAVDSGMTEQALMAAPTPVTVATTHRQYDAERLSCNPFGGSDSNDISLGLHGELFYLRPTDPAVSGCTDLVTRGVEHRSDLFFTELNVPTRMWTRGFPTAAGGILKSNTAGDLFEWFGIRFTSNLRIGPSSHPGKYQFALLSDDGSILRLNQGNLGLHDFISNDGTHPSRLAVSAHSIYMDRDTLIPLQLDYFQGPRYHISLLMLWREIPANQDEVIQPSILHEALNGQSGNNLWFNPDQPNSPMQPSFLHLLNEGWSVVPAENFVLPDDHPENPCCTTCGNGGVGV